MTGSSRERPLCCLDRSGLGSGPLSPRRNVTSSRLPGSLHGAEAVPLAQAMTRSSSIASPWVARNRTETACYESRPQQWCYEGGLDLSEHFRTEAVDSCARQDGSTPSARNPGTSVSHSQLGGRSSAAIPAVSDKRRLPETSAVRV